MDVFDAAMRYKEEERQLIVIAGKDYGSGSSRDWAAKGPWILVTTDKLIIITKLRKVQLQVLHMMFCAT